MGNRPELLQRLLRTLCCRLKVKNLLPALVTVHDNVQPEVLLLSLGLTKTYTRKAIKKKGNSGNIRIVGNCFLYFIARRIRTAIRAAPPDM